MNTSDRTQHCSNVVQTSDNTQLQCGLCSKSSSNHLVQIVKCKHVYCSLCILAYLKRRKFCPICVPFKKRKKFHFLTYLHPVKLVNKIKKHNKKVSAKHLKPLFVDEITGKTNQNCNSTGEFLIAIKLNLQSCIKTFSNN